MGDPRQRGWTEGFKREAVRLMRDNGLRALQQRRFKRTTDSQHNNPVASNLLEQDFTATGPNQKWGSDISYIWTAEGWLYLAIVVDLYSRRIVGWSVGDRLRKELPMAALQRALVTRMPPPGLVQHSDRGSQYCSGAYQQMLRDAGIASSMSGRENCFDNAMVETVLKTLKAELVWRTVFLSRQHAERALGHYIDGFYNPWRRLCLRSRDIVQQPLSTLQGQVKRDRVRALRGQAHWPACPSHQPPFGADGLRTAGGAVQVDHQVLIRIAAGKRCHGWSYGTERRLAHQTPAPLVWPDSLV
ncbi:IS3 family transposase [Pseudoroseomonas oryzae]|uniref:IS3 family transposase n=1 Tax=Teichococcus oryzae TaxID=1608942 RepID=A0A5B2T9F4_9PROT|nr:IS3 family transposase [Pseudoroseomonas oryzae]